MAISNETANKLLQGEFNTFYELESFEQNLLNIGYPNIEILYREQKNPNKDNIPVYIIETIFIDE